MRTLSNKIINKILANKNTANIGFKKNNKWNWITNKQLINSVINCRNILQEYKIDSEDRIAYKGTNSINWIAWNLASNSLGATWVPMYNDQSTSYTNFIIDDCKPKLLIQDEINYKYENIQTLSNYISCDENINNNINFIKPANDLATLIYTSGTTGNPKGVMLTNENILSNIESVNTLFFDSQKTISLNILPWAHIYSQTSELYYSLLFNNRLAISSGKTHFLDELKEIKPEVLYLVPRVLDLIKEKAQIFDKPIIKNIIPLILSRVFGGKLKYIFSGGAKLNNDTKKFYENNGIIICEGYGCSETSPMISVNHYNNPRNIDSVGEILDNIIVEIVNNEIQVSGPNVMLGYWNNIEKTNEVLVERYGKKWHKTGDSGEVKDGFLYINSRINDNYKLSNGKFVNVAELENNLKKYIKGPFIVFGENMLYNHIICTETIDLDEINKNIDSYLKIINYHKIKLEKFERFYTPKMSIKRSKLIDYIINPIY